MFTTTTRTITIRRLGAPLAVAALALAACGGSDDSDSSASDDGGGSDSEATNDDVSGSGSNDETQENLDELGIDLDLDELEETVNQLSIGDGGGVVTIDGTVYTFEAQVCFAEQLNFTAEGVGQDPDGNPAWVSISYSNDFDFDQDGQNDETLDLNVEVGKTEVFGSGPDDQPDWSASKINGASLTTGEDITFEFGGNTISGAGPINDFNFVALDAGDTAEMTFEASCS